MLAVVRWGSVMGYELVTEHFPFILNLLDGQATLEESNQFRAEMQEVLDRGNLFVQLVDLRYTIPESTEQRKLHSEFTNKNKDKIKSLSLGCAFVAPSVLLRTVLNFIMFFSPMPCQHKVVKDIPEAVKWLEGQLRKADMEIPESARPALAALEAKPDPRE